MAADPLEFILQNLPTVMLGLVVAVICLLAVVLTFQALRRASARDNRASYDFARMLDGAQQEMHKGYYAKREREERDRASPPR